jgi:3-deoxy-D-manno-octulosonate 8-phosphate phosphatase (KDO 8-P phosphatase)
MAIRAVVLDVDGVLTDDGFFWGPGGEEWKRFSFADVMGISLGARAGIVFALISGEASPLVDRYASKMSITDVYKGCKDKADALRDFSVRRGIPLAEICFVGNDVNDVAAMQIAGLAAAPADAHSSAKTTAAHVTHRRSGHGAVREVVDALLIDRRQGERHSHRE